MRGGWSEPRAACCRGRPACADAGMGAHLAPRAKEIGLPPNPAKHACSPAGLSSGNGIGNAGQEEEGALESPEDLGSTRALRMVVVGGGVWSGRVWGCMGSCP